MTEQNHFFPFLLKILEFREKFPAAKQSRDKMIQEGSNFFRVNARSGPEGSNAAYKMFDLMINSFHKRYSSNHLIECISDKLADFDFVHELPTEDQVYQAIIDGLVATRHLDFSGIENFT